MTGGVDDSSLFFNFFTSPDSCLLFDSSCSDALMIRRQRLADTALALLLRVKLTDPAPDGTLANRHGLCSASKALQDFGLFTFAAI